MSDFITHSLLEDGPATGLFSTDGKLIPPESNLDAKIAFVLAVGKEILWVAKKEGKNGQEFKRPKAIYKEACEILFDAKHSSNLEYFKNSDLSKSAYAFKLSDEGIQLQNILNKALRDAENAHGQEKLILDKARWSLVEKQKLAERPKAVPNSSSGQVTTDFVAAHLRRKRQR